MTLTGNEFPESDRGEGEFHAFHLWLHHLSETKKEQMHPKQIFLPKSATSVGRLVSLKFIRKRSILDE